MKSLVKWFVLSSLFLVLIFSASSTKADSGTCGDNLNWNLDLVNHTLVIDGTGAMSDYIEEGAPWYRRSSYIYSIIIEDGVTSIGDNAFWNCVDSTSITIPDSVTSFGKGALFGCGQLTSIPIPNGVISIGESAFAGCANLTDITIPNSVTAIGDRAFAECRSLTSITIPDTISRIGDYTFNNCKGLTSITIPDSVTSFGISSFASCNRLTSIIIPDGVTSIEASTFRFCYNLTSVTIPEGVTSIGEKAFDNCSGILNISLPDSIISIGNDAYNNCRSLVSVKYDGSEDQWNSISIGTGNDYLISAEKEYNINPLVASGTCGVNLTWKLRENGELTITGTGAMSDYSSYGSPWNRNVKDIKTIIIKNGVTSIDGLAFSKCSNLTSITIPNSVISIGNAAFNDCSSLNSIIIPESITRIEDNTFYNCSSLTNITIPNSVTSIGDSAFRGCSNITDITIPGSVSSIEGSAFYGCSGLTSITIPDGVTCISSSSFSNCTGLISITIPNSVTSIEGSSFSDCSSLTSIMIPDGVTSIERYTFSGCNSLANITIPDSVTSIERYAFSGCSGLTSITIPESVTSIAEFVFKGCSGLTHITIPESVTVLGDSVFYKCSNLTDITISDSVTSIGYAAFSNCGNLKNIILPDGITSIKGSSFTNCTSLVSVTIPDSVTSIEELAFTGCSSLTSITIPDGVTNIGGGAFSRCTSLESIVIPGSVVSIWEDSFDQCANLNNIKASVCTAYVIQWAQSNGYGDKTTILSHAELTMHIPVAPTCIESGVEAYWSCSACNKLFSDEATITEIDEPVVIPALGHEWSEPNYTWSSDYSTVTATRVCVHDEEHLESEAVITTAEVTKAATCEEKGETTYISAAFDNEAFTLQTKTVDDIPALHHDWNLPTYIWNADNTMVTATRVCRHDESHVETETVGTVSEMTKAATCEANGETTYTSTAFENTAFSVQAKTVADVLALGHEWSEPTYSWDADNSRATATRICIRNAEHVEAESINTTSEIIKAATCESVGTTTYTADFTNEAFETQTKAINNIPALGHDWNVPTYHWDGMHVTASVICQHDENHTKQESATAEKHLVTSPKQELEGSYELIAAFEDESFGIVKQEGLVIPALNAMNVIYLPAFLTTIEEEAFCNVAAQAIIIPDGCKTIEPKAFKNCKNLIFVSIPESIEIPDDSFIDCPNVIVDLR